MKQSGYVAYIALMVVMVAALTAGSVGVAALIAGRDKENKKSFEKLMTPKKMALDTMWIEGNLFSQQEMKSHILLLDKWGKQFYSVHYFPDDMIFSACGDTVVYDAIDKKIIRNMSLQRRLGQSR